MLTASQYLELVQDRRRQNLDRITVKSGMNKQEALEARNRQIAMQLVADMNGGKQ